MQPGNPHSTLQEHPPRDFPEPPEFSSEFGAGQGGAGPVAEDIKQAGQRTARRAKEQGEAFLGEQKGTAADVFHDCGDALRGAAQELRHKQDQSLASLAESIADRLERASGYLNSRQIADIRGDIESFARRQPGAFYGGMFAAGLAMSRFFKASQQHGTGASAESGSKSAHYEERSDISPEHGVEINPTNPI